VSISPGTERPWVTFPPNQFSPDDMGLIMEITKTLYSIYDLPDDPQ
jgi:hypothetical protein